MSISNNLNITTQSRKAVISLMNSLTVDQINTIPQGFNNNIIWNAGHIMAIQQRFTYGMGGLPYTVDPQMVQEFNKGTKPEKFYSEEEINHIKTLLINTISQLSEDIGANKFSTFSTFTTAIKVEITDIESAIAFNQYHEALHMGNMLNLMRLVR